MSLLCSIHICTPPTTSTGMDPVARRFMWDVIARMSTRSKAASSTTAPGGGSGGSAVVLTTHSMEEAEALCSRVGIMVGGRLRCLGSCQHLKNKYAQGFQAELKLAVPSRYARERANMYVGMRVSHVSEYQISRIPTVCS